MIGITEAPPARLARPDLQEELVFTLRLELEEYGGLLAHFETQQDAILERKPELVLEIAGRIEAQMETARVARKKREALARTVAQAAGFPEQTSLKELSPFFRPVVRPMIEALTAEVNRLINHTRRKAQQNQMLLSRAMEVTQEILGRLNPETVTRTYSPGGKVKMNTASRGSRLVDCG